MNTYICSVCSKADEIVYTEVISANNYQQAVDKLRKCYDEDNKYDLLDYDEFVDKLFENEEILIGEILEIEELEPTIK